MQQEAALSHSLMSSLINILGIQQKEKTRDVDVSDISEIRVGFTGLGFFPQFFSLIYRCHPLSSVFTPVHGITKENK